MTNEEEFLLGLMTKLRKAYEQVLSSELKSNPTLLSEVPDSPIIHGEPDQTTILKYIPSLLRILHFVQYPKLKIRRLDPARPQDAPPEVKQEMARDLAWLAKGAVGATKGLMSPKTEQSEMLLEVCKGCDQWTGKSCKVCGCFVSLKVRIPEEKCPLGKW